MAETEKISDVTPKTEIEPEKSPAAAELNANRHDGVPEIFLNLLDLLPKNGQPWTDADRERMKIAFGNILDLAYPTIDDTNRRML